MESRLQPLTIDFSRLDGLSQALIASHHENNDAGAVRRLDAIRRVGRDSLIFRRNDPKPLS